MKKSIYVAVLLCAVPVCAQPATEFQPITPDELGKLIGPPTTLTLNQEAPAEMISEAIGQQSGLTVRANGVQKTMRVNWQNVPFWDAVGQLGEQEKLYTFEMAQLQGLCVPPYQLFLVEGGKESLPPLRQKISPYIWFEVTSVTVSKPTMATFRRAAQIPAEEETHHLKVNGTLLIDPKFRALETAYRLEVNSATDDKRRVWNGNAQVWGQIPSAGALSKPCFFNLSYGAFIGSKSYDANGVLLESPSKEPSRKLTSLNGKLAFSFAARNEKWEVPDVLNVKNAKTKIALADGTWTFVMEGIKPEGKRYSVTIFAIPPGGKRAIPTNQPNSIAFSELSSSWLRRIQLLDAEGKRYQASSVTGGPLFDRTQVKLIFEKADGGADVILGQRPPTGPPAKLVVEIPTDFRQMEIPFEIRDIPLPTVG